MDLKKDDFESLKDLLKEVEYLVKKAYLQGQKDMLDEFKKKHEKHD